MTARRLLIASHQDLRLNGGVAKTCRQKVRLFRDAGWEVETLPPPDWLLARPRLLPFAFPPLVAAAAARHQGVLIAHSWAGAWVSLAVADGRLRRLRLITEFHGLEPLYTAAAVRWGFTSPRQSVMHHFAINPLSRLAARHAHRTTLLNREELAYVTERWRLPRGRVAVGLNTPFDGPAGREPIPGHPAATAGNPGRPDAGPHRIAGEAAARAAGDAPRRLDAPARPSIAFCGTWIARKGIAAIVAAFDRVLIPEDGVRLVLLGTGFEPHEVLRSFGAGRDVTVIPSYDGDQLPGLLAGHAAFVFPSLSEAFGLAAVEAAVAGLPLVMTSLTGFADHLVADCDYVAVAPGSARSLVAGVRRVLADPDRWQRTAARVRDFCRERFSFSAYARFWLEQAERAWASDA